MTPRYRRSSVQGIVEAVARDDRLASEAHDALWAALWNRRYDDVSEPLWSQEAAFGGILVFARRFADGESLTGLDVGEAFLVFRGLPPAPPVGSRVRVVPTLPGQWKFGDGVQPLGLGIELRFDEHGVSVDGRWVAPLRTGLTRLQEALEGRGREVAARRAQLGARSEPTPLEEIWRAEVSAIAERVTVETEYSPEEQATIRRARAKGSRSADEVENKLAEARRRRLRERTAEEVARFREERWPAIRDAASEALRTYAEYRGEVVKLEDALQRLRALGERARNAAAMVDAIEAAGFLVRASAVDPARAIDARYADELLRSIELLHAAIPRRAHAAAATFSAYRAPTAARSATPPRA